MNSKLTLNVSGMRGVWGDNLTLESAEKYIRAFGTFLLLRKPSGVRIVLGQDGRQSGSTIARFAGKILSEMGINVTDAGIAPTPTIMFTGREMNFDGGIMITGSHNPIEYNGLKFFDNGFFLNQESIEKIRALAERGHFPIPKNEPAKIVKNSPALEAHIKKVLENIDAESIKKMSFKVALDPVNGSGIVGSRPLLEALGCEITAINDEPNGLFAHIPEPLPINLKDLGKLVSASKADIGFSQDPDADRLVLANEKGEIINEELALALCVEHVLSEKEGDVVINISTSWATEDIAERHGRKTFRTKIGENNVVEEMKNVGAVIGGEGNGGIIYPQINFCRDSLTGIGLILDLMAKRKKKISELSAEIPKYFRIKEKIPLLGNLEPIYNELKNKFTGASINELDGMRFDWPDRSWVQIRPSNTEPIVRIFGEAKTEERIDTIFSEVRLILASQ